MNIFHIHHLKLRLLMGTISLELHVNIAGKYNAIDVVQTMLTTLDDAT